MRHRISTIMKGALYGFSAALVAAFLLAVTSQPQVIKAAADQKPAVVMQ